MIKTISIIGGTGKIGNIFAQAFKEKGFEVLVASRNTSITVEEAASKGDLVIISVPINVTPDIIKKVAPLVRKDAILLDFTSVKTDPCKLMKSNSTCNVIGGHPLFGPGVSLNGQTFVLCNIRGSKLSEFKSLLESLGLNIVVMDPKQHDKQMAIIQCMNQFSNIGFASALVNEKFSLEKKEIFTPAFNLKLAVLGRTLSQNPDLYPEILIENPYAKKIINNYIRSLKEIQKLIKKKDEKALENKVVELKDYFKSLAEESRETTNKLLHLMKEK